jgi:anti-sigma B factor antagonist
MKIILTPIDIGEVTVIESVGRLTLGESTAVFRDLIHELSAAGRHKVLLDLTHVNYIDSSGTGELVSAYVKFRNQGGAVKLLNLTVQVRELLQITKLYTIFEIYDDKRKAIDSFLG